MQWQLMCVLDGAEEGTEYRLKSPLFVADPSTGLKNPAQQPCTSPPGQNTPELQTMQQPAAI